MIHPDPPAPAPQHTPHHSRPGAGDPDEANTFFESPSDPSEGQSPTGRTPLIAAALIVLVFFVWLAAGIGGRFATRAVDDVGLFLVAGTASLVCFRAARRHRGQERQAWLLLAIALASWTGGEVVWTWYELFAGRQVPFPSLADMGYLGLVPFALAGMLRFGSHSTRLSRLRQLLDGALAAGSLLLVSWTTALGVIYRASPSGSVEKAVGLAYPVADVMILVAAASLVATRHDKDRRPFMLIAAGFAVIAFSDSAFAYLTTTGLYSTGTIVDVGWVLGFVLIGLAALSPYRNGRTESTVMPTQSKVTLAPIVFAIVAATTMIMATLLAGEDDFVVIVGASTLLLLVARQVLVLADRAHLEQRLAHQGLHDPLTGLANRALLHSHLQRALAIQRRCGTQAALLVIDLDDFKTVNDSLGHGAGDELLAEVGRRLVECCRESDLIARTGGDEFAILLRSVDAERSAIDAATRVADHIGTPYLLRDRVTQVTAGMGGSLLGVEDQEPDQVLTRADIAMYVAKRVGKGTVRMFEPSMQLEVVERLTLIGDLHDALRGEQFRLYFQPIFDLRSGTVAGFEALLRWFHPTRGLLSPGSFMQYLEEAGLIVPIGRWALRNALIAAAEWVHEHPSHQSLMLNVNVSVVQLHSPHFVNDVRNALYESEFPPEQLVVEVTETTLIAEPEAIATVLSELRAMGVKVAIDDFGAGFSSLSHLTRLPVDVLKIDQSFIQLLDARTEDSQLVAALCKIGNTLGFKVVAEGVETPAQLHHLVRMGCEYGQGYVLGHPLPAHEVADMLAGSEPRSA